MKTLVEKGKVFLAAVVFLLATSAYPAPFQQMFDDVYADLMNPANNPDLLNGEVHPEYGDAYVYVPALFFHRAAEGLSSEDEIKIAEAFVDRYDEYLSAFAEAPFGMMMRDFDVVMHAYIGVGGVYYAYFYEPEGETKALIEKYLDSMEIFVKLAHPLMYYHMEPYGPMVPLAGLAAFYLQYPLTFGRDSGRAQRYEELGFRLIEKLDKSLWCEKKGKYKYSLVPGYDFTYVYNNATMVQALVRAYYISNDANYLDRARRIMETAHRDLYHAGYEGYLAAEDSCRYYRKYKKVGPQYNREYMALSANNYMAFGWLLLYEAGGFEDAEMLDRAGRAISFSEEWLWDHEGKIQHHIERGALAGPGDYCAGCNFQSLYNIFLYNLALEKKRILPR